MKTFQYSLPWLLCFLIFYVPGLPCCCKALRILFNRCSDGVASLLLSSTYLDVGDSWSVELQTGLPLSAPVPVETFQQEAADGQPLTGCELWREMERVARLLAQFVRSVDVQPRSVHVECAWRIKRQTWCWSIPRCRRKKKTLHRHRNSSYLPIFSAGCLWEGFSSVILPPAASGCCSWLWGECCTQTRLVSGESEEAESCSLNSSPAPGKWTRKKIK